MLKVQIINVKAVKRAMTKTLMVQSPSQIDSTDSGRSGNRNNLSLTENVELSNFSDIHLFSKYALTKVLDITIMTKIQSKT